MFPLSTLSVSRENIESSHDVKIVCGLMTINICMYM